MVVVALGVPARGGELLGAGPLQAAELGGEAVGLRGDGGPFALELLQPLVRAREEGGVALLFAVAELLFAVDLLLDQADLALELAFVLGAERRGKEQDGERRGGKQGRGEWETFGSWHRVRLWHFSKSRIRPSSGPVPGP